MGRFRAARALAAVYLIVTCLALGTRGQTAEEPPWSRLLVGDRPVAVAIAYRDRFADLVVLNSGPSATARTLLATEIAKVAPPTADSILQDLPSLGSVSIFYGTSEARFYPLTEIILYRELAANKTVPEGVLRVLETLPGTEPSTLLAVNRDGCGILVLNNASPYVFNLKADRDGSQPFNTTSIVNLDRFLTSQTIEDLQFPLGDPSMAVGEFNGDGVLDLAIANNSTYTLTIYQGKGNGTFFDTSGSSSDMDAKIKMHEWSVGGPGDEPRFVAVGDLNGDGRDDLVVARGGILSRSISAFLSNGDGTFRAATEAPATQVPRSVVVEDFNRDGLDDLVVAGATNLVYLSGKGDGTFGGKATIGNIRNVASVDRPVGMVAGDFNRDGCLDFAVANIGNDSVDVYYGTGAGAFTAGPSRSLGAGSLPIALDAGDLDMDGDLDLAVALYGYGEVAILLNKNGSFGRLLRPLTGWGTCELALAGFDKEPGTDLGVARTNLDVKNAATVTAVKDTVAANYKPVQRLSVIFQQAGVSDLAMITNPFKDALAIKAAPLAYTGTVPSGAFPVGSLPASLGFADFNLDGRQEMAAASFSANSLWAWDTTQKDATVIQFSKWIPSLSAGAITCADFTGDSNPDIAVSHLKANGAVYLLHGNGAGAFEGAFDLDGSALTLPVPDRCDAGEWPTAIASGDFNDDGRLDLAALDWESDTLSVVLNTGGLPAFQVSEEFSICTSPTAIVAGDFDRDGHLDLAISSFDSGLVWVLENDGSGRFGSAKQIQEAKRIPVGKGPIALALGYAKYSDAQGGEHEISLTPDPYPDLVVANYLSDDVTILVNDGTGGFTEERIATIPQNVSGVGDNGSRRVLLGNGPCAIAVGFLDDPTQPARTLDVVFSVDFPASKLEGPKASSFPNLWQDTFAFYGPLELEQVSR